MKTSYLHGFILVLSGLLVGCDSSSDYLDFGNTKIDRQLITVLNDGEKQKSFNDRLNGLCQDVIDVLFQKSDMGEREKENSLKKVSKDLEEFLGYNPELGSSTSKHTSIGPCPFGVKEDKISVQNWKCLYTGGLYCIFNIGIFHRENGDPFFIPYGLNLPRSTRTSEKLYKGDLIQITSNSFFYHFTTDGGKRVFTMGQPGTPIDFNVVLVEKEVLRTEQRKEGKDYVNYWCFKNCE